MKRGTEATFNDRKSEVRNPGNPKGLLCRSRGTGGLRFGGVWQPRCRAARV